MKQLERLLVLAFAAVTVASACGPGSSSTGPAASKPTTAQAVLDRMDRSKMADGHVLESTHMDGIDLSGEGWFIFRPSMADYGFETATVNGRETFLEQLAVGSVAYMKAGTLADRASMKWQRMIWDRVLSDPSAYILGVTKNSSLVRTGVNEESIGTAKAWRIEADAPDGLAQVWIRQSDGFLLQYKLTSADGSYHMFTFDRFNISPTINLPAESNVVDGPPTCGFLTSAVQEPGAYQRLCGLDQAGAELANVDFSTIAAVPDMLFPAVMDYTDNQPREGEGLTLINGAAVLHSENWNHEADLYYGQKAADIVAILDYDLTGAAASSELGIAVRCNEQACIFAQIRPDGHFALMERTSPGSSYKAVLSGTVKLNTAGLNRLVVWARADHVCIALNGTLLGDYKTTITQSESNFVFHRSTSDTAPSDQRLLRLAFYKSTVMTLYQLMGR